MSKLTYDQLEDNCARIQNMNLRYKVKIEEQQKLIDTLERQNAILKDIIDRENKFISKAEAELKNKLYAEAEQFVWKFHQGEEDEHTSTD